MIEQKPLIPLGTGERLRQAREKRKWSRADTASALHVPLDVLDAIERDDLDRFAPVYQRGYIQAYARHLGFDDAVIRELLAGIDRQSPELHSVFPRAARRHRADRWLRATSYVLASLLIGTLAWQFTHEAVRLSQHPGAPATAQPAVSTDQTGTVPEQDPTRTATHVNASIAALENLPPGGAAGRETDGRENGPVIPPADGYEGQAGLPDGEHQLSVFTSGDSWIEILDAQGRQLELDLVRGGSERQYQGTAPFRILLGRASAVELFMDGTQVDTGPFTNGDVTQMTLRERSSPIGDGPTAESNNE